MKTFEAPKAVIKEFSVEDILTTSGEATEATESSSVRCPVNVEGPCPDD